MIMEKMNIAEILINCKRGIKLYSPLIGECEFEYVDETFKIKVKYLLDNGDRAYIWFYEDGSYLDNGRCMLFPSEDVRDWSEFNKPKFDPKTLKPFDKVLVRSAGIAWKCGLFSHILNNVNVQCVGSAYRYCIPYNEETKHLIGTHKEAPEFYRYWE